MGKSVCCVHEIMVFQINLLDLFEFSLKINSHNDIRVVWSVWDRSIAHFLKSMPFFSPSVSNMLPSTLLVTDGRVSFEARW